MISIIRHLVYVFIICKCTLRYGVRCELNCQVTDCKTALYHVNTFNVSINCDMCLLWGTNGHMDASWEWKLSCLCCSTADFTFPSNDGAPLDGFCQFCQNSVTISHWISDKIISRNEISSHSSFSNFCANSFHFFLFHWKKKNL